ncbi:MAG: cytochrome b [Gammaproteobacteria bacterium]|nr:cytochrome b [Gammaproteobacteria bacterium]
MQWKNTSERYGAIAQLFHWLIVLMIIGQFILVAVFDDLPSGAEKVQIVGLHKAMGMLILLLVALRLIWRWLNPVPVLPATQNKYQRWLARAVHDTLYLLLFAIPLSGWLMSSLAGRPVGFFGWFVFPSLASANKEMAHTLHEVHEMLPIVLLVLVALHILAALLHHFVMKDDVLRRMLP